MSSPLAEVPSLVRTLVRSKRSSSPPPLQCLRHRQASRAKSKGRNKVEKKTIDKTQRENQFFFGFRIKMWYAGCWVCVYVCVCLCESASVCVLISFRRQRRRDVGGKYESSTYYFIFHFPFFGRAVGRRVSLPCSRTFQAKWWKRKQCVNVQFGQSKSTNPTDIRDARRIHTANIQYRPIDLEPHGQRFTDPATASIAVIFISSSSFCMSHAYLFRC